MPAPRSSRSASRSGGTGKPRQGSAGKRSTAARSRGGKATGGSKTAKAPRSSPSTKASSKAARGVEGLSSLMEQLVNHIIRPLDLVMLSRGRIQETLDDAAERGRMTRGDANALVAELVRRGREQTDDVLSDFEQLVGCGPGGLPSAKTYAWRSVGVGASFPISGYDELTASQVSARLESLAAAELRKLRDYEARHANRKSVLDAIERALVA